MNRFVPALRSQLPRVVPAPARAFASSSRRAAEEAADQDAANSSTSAQGESEGAQEGGVPKTEEIQAGTKITYTKWMRTAEAERYRRPTPGKPNWIGETVRVALVWTFCAHTKRRRSSQSESCCPAPRGLASRR